MELRYENVIDSPAATLIAILDFLQLEGDPGEMLSGFKLHDRSIGAWRTVFSRRDRKTFAEVAGDLLIELGYERDQSWVESASRSAGSRGRAYLNQTVSALMGFRIFEAMKESATFVNGVFSSVLLSLPFWEAMELDVMYKLLDRL